jgi:hypothetical protein
MDQQVVCHAFSAMIANGWQRQNTLGHNYFHPETQALNQAGQRKLYEILTTTPEQYRTVFVVRTMDREDAEKRIDAVQQSVAGMLLGDQVMPEVMAVSIEPRGWPADYIDQIDRKRMSSIQNPRLPAFVSTTDAE